MAERDIAAEIAVKAGAEDKAAAARADLPAAAKRALAEAAARRRQAAAESGAEAGANIAAEQIEGEAETNEIAVLPNHPAQPKELGGRREGKEPTRYGDWEFKGRAIDF